LISASRRSRGWLKPAGFLLLCGILFASIRATAVEISLPKHRLYAEELAVIVNDADPLSVRIGSYYQKARHIPAANVVHVRFQPGRPHLSTTDFLALQTTLDAKTAPHIQAYAITWAAPYRVECMSITTAITFGFDKAFCSRQRCAATRSSPYFGRRTTAPYRDLGIRPTIAIAATSFEAAKALIDRGIQADQTQPAGTAYLVSTSDRARNVRSLYYPKIEQHMVNWLKTEIVDSDALRDRDDVLFYFTGKLRVSGLETLQFVPGAIADHLTSTGGRLTDSRQMSALRWLEAGATGSYGTVVEPCNLPGKFPNPALAIESYSSGRTLLESYWSSVQQPGEGIFIGEPLAAPFDGYQLENSADGPLLRTRTLSPGYYWIETAASPIGPFQRLSLLRADYHQQLFRLPPVNDGYLRLTPLNRPSRGGLSGLAEPPAGNRAAVTELPARQ